MIIKPFLTLNGLRKNPKLIFGGADTLLQKNPSRSTREAYFYSEHGHNIQVRNDGIFNIQLKLDAVTETYHLEVNPYEP
jgi:hypothetical protein